MAAVEGETKLTGPDFRAGVDDDILADGEKLLGHAQGEPVLHALRGTAR